MCVRCFIKILLWFELNLFGLDGLSDVDWSFFRLEVLLLVEVFSILVSSFLFIFILEENKLL